MAGTKLINVKADTAEDFMDNAHNDTGNGKIPVTKGAVGPGGYQ